MRYFVYDKNDKLVSHGDLLTADKPIETPLFGGITIEMPNGQWARISMAGTSVVTTWPRPCANDANSNLSQEVQT